MKPAKSGAIRSIELAPRLEALFHYRPLASLSVPAGRPETPHRHNFQELIWIRAGRGRHAIDGQPCELLPGTCYFIAKGQVHQFLEAHAIAGGVVRFADELIADLRGAEETLYPLAWFNSAGGARGVRLDKAEAAEYERLLSLLADEFARPPQAGRREILGGLLRVALVKLGRVLMRSQAAANAPGEPRAELFRAFILRLERDYAGHHDVAYYAAALKVAPRRLSDACRLCVGRMPKAIIEERLVLEAKRMLQFSPRPTKEIAYELGFQDPSYFSKVFRRMARCSPLDYRRRLQALPA
jgi:AraC family transcriptional activator of pobA